MRDEIPVFGMAANANPILDIGVGNVKLMDLPEELLERIL
jgi:hypothetical protein